jgi:hypothetical protein
VEKASSIAFIDAVYSGCQRVLVWLGEMDPREAASIYVLHFEILPEMVKYIQKHGGQAIQTGDWTMYELIERFGLGRPMAQMENWKSYRNLFQNYMWVSRLAVLSSFEKTPRPNSGSLHALGSYRRLPFHPTPLLCLHTCQFRLRIWCFLLAS